MKEHYFNHIKMIFPYIITSNSFIDDNHRWEIQSVEDLNDNHKKTIEALIKKLLNNQLWGYLPQTTKTGGMSNIYLI